MQTDATRMAGTSTTSFKVGVLLAHMPKMDVKLYFKPLRDKCDRAILLQFQTSLTLNAESESYLIASYPGWSVREAYIYEEYNRYLHGDSWLCADNIVQVQDKLSADTNLSITSPSATSPAFAGAGTSNAPLNPSPISPSDVQILLLEGNLLDSGSNVVPVNLIKAMLELSPALQTIPAVGSSSEISIASNKTMVDNTSSDTAASALTLKSNAPTVNTDKENYSEKLFTVFTGNTETRPGEKTFKENFETSMAQVTLDDGMPLNTYVGYGQKGQFQSPRWVNSASKTMNHRSESRSPVKSYRARQASTHNKTAALDTVDPIIVKAVSGSSSPNLGSPGQTIGSTSSKPASDSSGIAHIAGPATGTSTDEIVLPSGANHAPREVPPAANSTPAEPRREVATVFCGSCFGKRRSSQVYDASAAHALK